MQDFDSHVQEWKRMRSEWLRDTLIMPWTEYLSWYHPNYSDKPAGKPTK